MGKVEDSLDSGVLKPNAGEIDSWSARKPGGTDLSFVVTKRVATFLIAVLYGALIAYDYEKFISPAFSYMGFHFFSHSPWITLTDLVLLAIPCLYLPMAIRRPSDMGLLLIYIIVYVPGILATSIAAAQVTVDSYVMKIAMLTSFALLQWIAGWRIPLPPPRPLFGPRAGMLFVMSGALLSVVGLGVTFGFSLKFHALTEVYDQRNEFKDTLETAGRSATWFVGALTHVFAPFLLAYGLTRKSPLHFFIGVFLQFYVFSITGLKSSVMTIIYVSVVYLAMTFARRIMLLAMISATFLIVILGISAASIFGVSLVNELFVRRLFMIQGLLTNVYYQFMQPLPPLLLSHSILSPFFSSPILADPEGAVGASMFNADMHANAALWADAYMNGKFVGIYIGMLVVGSFLAFLNYCTSRSDIRFACCALCMTYMTVCQTGVIKVAGVHGGLLAGFLFLLISIPQRGGRRGRGTQRT